ncbi:hypothetical protein Gogos_009979 [Gossypium gossypioides]|uniref:Uncharacterized protein n=1 Tax=Gossypium gossypioides TaxID=34282 RepID=A0A7J9BJS2_GOSGO|nr:hypothetical protein [Gossypium gossypioides]
METLVVVAHQRNQYCSRVKPHGPARFGSSQPSRNFRGVNCRTFQSGAGLLPTPRAPRNDKPFNVEIPGEGFLYSELWAGPAYSNSPPPSSLPIPKFSLRVKRTVSLDLPAAYPIVDVHQTAKSAPASPTRELDPSVAEVFCSAASATKALRRILNLDNTDD